uniref:Retrotransposon gag domain-containing protein n=2 Tax=Cucumis sativus TaxID=3659 RepID=A0A0A0LR88_CUCSA
MTVVEYEKKYTKLSKYATSLIEDEAKRCKRFEEGLREKIRTPMSRIDLDISLNAEPTLYIRCTYYTCTNSKKIYSSARAS